MTLGDRPGRTARADRLDGMPVPPATGADGPTAGDAPEPTESSTGRYEEVEQPAFGPWPPPGPGRRPAPPQPGESSPHRSGDPSAASPGTVPWATTSPNSAPPASPDTAPQTSPDTTPHTGPSTVPPASSGHRYGRTDEPAIDPFCDLGSGACAAPDPPWARPATPPSSGGAQSSDPPGGTGEDPGEPGRSEQGKPDPGRPRPGRGRQRSGGQRRGRSKGTGAWQSGAGPAGPGPSVDDTGTGPPDELIPPVADETEPVIIASPHQVVATLQPANISRLPVLAAPLGPAGEPPAAAMAAAVLCGILSVPMLATAGSLLGGGVGTFGVLLPVVTLLMAVGSVLGGIRLVQRGSPLLALLDATFVLISAAGSVFRLVAPSILDAILAVIWTLAALIALIMVGLLRRRHVRRWLMARSREWQAGRPPPRRRPRLHLPDWPGRPAWLRLPRRSPALRRTRRPRRVRQVGRHVKARRGFGFPRRRGPVSFVGRDSPDSAQERAPR